MASGAALWWAEWAYAGRVAADVLIETAGGRIVRLVPESGRPPAGAERLRGLTLPGFANAHSHAFHRALRGRTHARGGDFWTWREAMYGVAAGLDPERYLALARATYAEMALAGITAVGEFHYLHHQKDGRPYADPNAMGRALVEAAAAAGVRLTLLDACYLHGGIDGRPLAGAQLRFGDGSADGWAARVEAMGPGDGVRWMTGAAIHSVRAVDPAAMTAVASWARVRGVPLHLHLAEQPLETRECRAATGRTPAELVAACGVLGPRTTCVHATHVTPSDIVELGRSGSTICVCPTTERDLADGIGPADRLLAAGSRLCTGSDGQAVIDPFEEARAIELDLRLASGRRGVLGPAALLDAATASGAAGLGWDAGELAPGRLADWCTIGLDSPRLAGWAPAHGLGGAIFAATAADVARVVVGGETIVRDGRHLRLGDVAAALRAALRLAETG
ncbi:MAG TPA: formimidoylglutamate deiminase [Candidatus Micrarchaeia archaeon]|nr:formimidoylglutamate deiminase [Candidatus Micrarchaeia archaeon]